MSERQEHGLLYENYIKNNFILSPKSKDENKTEVGGYTAVYDAHGALIDHPEYGDVWHSIKAFKNCGSIGMADLERNFSHTHPFVLWAVNYFCKSKDSPTLETPVKIYRVHIDDYELYNNLFMFNKYNDFYEAFVNQKEVTNSHEDDSKWRALRLKYQIFFNEERPRIVTMNPKRDHKHQHRIQCSISNRHFFSDFLPLFQHEVYSSFSEIYS